MVIICINAVFWDMRLRRVCGGAVLTSAGGGGSALGGVAAVMGGAGVGAGGVGTCTITGAGVAGFGSRPSAIRSVSSSR